ncbi:MAG: hypothetical protein RL227_1877, partial [Pseudomonadota bacterium]
GWLHRSALQGHAPAMRELGRALLGAPGVAADARAAARWLQQAAGHDDGEAMAMLGSLYARGEGLAEDARAACDWYRQAADLGVALGEFGLGAC